MIPYFYHENNSHHAPIHVLSQTGLSPHPDLSNRIDLIRDVFESRQIGKIGNVEKLDYNLLRKIHTDKYLNFLEGTAHSFVDNGYYFPLEFNSRPDARIMSEAGGLGHYCLDTNTPISINTYEHAISSCSLAYSAAVHIGNGGPAAYALCRPSGHHAMKNYMGGFCYLNNAAVCAQYLSDLGKVCILDLDFHHSNGTQDIFYDRGDVLTISIHADCRRHPPYYWGFEDERGACKG
ncbi:MAG: histone deacetylase family protein, partial [bacterium]|nr:histone deacetylase family protein [bacterium]